MVVFTVSIKRALLVVLLAALGTGLQAESGDSPESAPKTYALATTLGSQIQVVQRRAPGARWYSYQRRMIASSEAGVDAAVLRGLEAAVANAESRSSQRRLELSIPQSVLWRWRGSRDSPLPNVLDVIKAMPERAGWDEILLVTPMLVDQPIGVPAVRRGAGIFMDVSAVADDTGKRGTTGATVSVHVNAKVWRVDARTLATIASESVVRTVTLDPLHTEGDASDAPLPRLQEVAAESVTEAATRLLLSPAGADADQTLASAAAARYSPSKKSSAEQPMPKVEVIARHVACPELQWRWYDAIAAAYEQRHYGSSFAIPTKFDEAMRNARSIARAAFDHRCLIRVSSDCADDTADSDHVAADSGDTWQERDTVEELQARGVDSTFVELHLPYFARPERCRTPNSPRAP